MGGLFTKFYGISLIMFYWAQNQAFVVMFVIIFTNNLQPRNILLIRPLYICRGRWVIKANFLNKRNWVFVGAKHLTTSKLSYKNLSGPGYWDHVFLVLNPYETNVKNPCWAIRLKFWPWKVTKKMYEWFSLQVFGSNLKYLCYFMYYPYKFQCPLEWTKTSIFRFAIIAYI